jgi:hypothetical protein
MKIFVKAAALAGALIVVFATVSADLNPADIDKTVREHQAVVTGLGANASAITYWVNEPDGWHVVTTVDTVIGEHDDAEHHAWSVSSRCCYQASRS